MENEELLNILKKLEETEKLIKEYLGKNKPNTPTMTKTIEPKKSHTIKDFIPDINIETVCKQGLLKDINDTKSTYYVDIVIPKVSSYRVRYFLRYKPESGWLYFIKTNRNNDDITYPRFITVCYKHEVPKEWFTKILSDYDIMYPKN